MSSNQLLRADSRTTRLPRRFFVAFCLFVAGLGLLGASSYSTAAAETGSERQTSWGVQTKGASHTIGNWKALTWAIEQVDNTIFVGGNFLQVTNGGQVGDQPYLAAFDADTGIWQPWFRPEVGNAVFALEASPDGGLFVGGEMGSWNGSQIGAFQKIDPTTGDVWPGWNVRAYGGTSVVRDIKLESDGWLYVVGGFTTASSNGAPQAVDGAFRLDPITGVIDSSWKPRLDGGTGWGVARSKVSATTYIAGFFDSVNSDTAQRGFVGVSDAGIAVVGRSVVPYNGCTGPGYCSQLYDVETTASGKLFVAGVEHSLYVLNELASYTMEWHHYAGCSPDHNSYCNPVNWIGGEFQELEQAGGRVYATCHCFYDMFSANSVQLHTQPTGEHSTLDTVTAFDPETGERIQSFRPYLAGTSGGFAIHVNESDGCVWLGGGITSYGPPDGTHLAARDVVRLCDTAGAGLTAQPDPGPPSATSCAATLVGSQLDLTWSNPTYATSAVVERQIDGGDWYWRGKVDSSATTFSEDIPADVPVAYRIRSRYETNQLSDGTTCGQPITRVNTSQAPATCHVTLTGTTVDVSWTAPAGVSSFIVYRAVDGGNHHWRGRTDADVVSFADAISAGPTFEYFVAAKNADGYLSPQTPCAPPVSIAGADVQPVTSCSATVVGTEAKIDWPAADNAASYIVRRSVNGGKDHWRGRVDAPDVTFNDELLNDITFVYSVTSKASDGTLSDSVECSPSVTLNATPLAAPTSCVVVFGPTEAVLTWATSPDADTTIVFRDNGTKTHWRGRVDNAGATFTDSGDSATFTYLVRAQADNGTRSESATCAIG